VWRCGRAHACVRACAFYYQARTVAFSVSASFSTHVPSTLRPTNTHEGCVLHRVLRCAHCTRCIRTVRTQSISHGVHARMSHLQELIVSVARVRGWRSRTVLALAAATARPLSHPTNGTCSKRSRSKAAPHPRCPTVHASQLCAHIHTSVTQPHSLIAMLRAQRMPTWGCALIACCIG
jgi:hypothetical protein